MRRATKIRPAVSKMMPPISLGRYSATCATNMPASPPIRRY